MKKLAAAREFKAVWFSLPILLALLILSALYLPLAFVAPVVILILALALILITSSMKTTALRREIMFERNQLRSIMAALDDAILSYDHSFRISFWNSAAEKLFQIPKASALGRAIEPQGAGDQVWRRLTQVVYPSLAPVMAPRSPLGEYPEVVDLSFTDPELELRVVTAPVLNELGESLGFVKIIHDRTHEISLLKSKNEFITVASHQLRTPITEVNWAVEALAGMSLPADAATIIANMTNSARELTRITEDLLSIAKIEEGHFGYEFEQKDLVEFIETKLSEIYPLIEAAKLKIYFDKPTNPAPPASFDSNKLSIVLTNFLENAIRYNTANGEIIVKIEAVPGKPFLRVSVRDTGIGMSPEDAARVFTKFFRSENALKYETKGNGLGLYIAKKIIQSHGGEVGVQSELNRGSLFWFTVSTDPGLVPRREVPTEY